jgi:phosphoribosyl 1,2-cyclic phosphate phosphodiesterase
MSLRLRVLGCGSSGGVPRVAMGWGACDPSNPKNRRRRCSVLVTRFGEAGATRVLVDASPDLREQLIDADVRSLDAVLVTHEHADHIHGIDDLRGIWIATRRRVPLHCDAATGHVLRERFGYCFDTPPGSDYPPILAEHRIAPGERVAIDGAGGTVEAWPFRVEHGNIDALGFRFGKLAYTPDVKAVPPESEPFLDGLDIWLVDALRHAPHPSHWSLEETLAAIARFRPKRAILTNMHNDLDHATLLSSLPAGIEPAHDGLELDFG